MKRFIFIFLITIISGFTVNDAQKEFIALNWSLIDNKSSGLYTGNSQMFDNAVFIDDESGLPVFIKTYPLDGIKKQFSIKIEQPQFEEWNPQNDKSFVNHVNDEVQVEATTLKSGENFRLQVKIIPLIKKDDKFFRLTDFTLSRIPVHLKSAKTTSYAWQTSSVLRNGKWMKISTAGKGIYKIPFSKLRNWGFENPANVNVFGSGGRILAEDPGNIAYDDLPQVAVWQGKNNGADCLFFYAPGTIEWEPDRNNEYFQHVLNEYTTKGYFFLTEDAGTKTVGKASEIAATATHQITTFDAYDLYEVEEFNLLPEGSGKQWFGDKFINSSVKNIDFNLENLASPESVSVKINAAARSSSNSEMPVTVNQTKVGEIAFQKVETDESLDLFADERNIRFSPSVSGNQLALTLKYFASSSNAEAWLDYVELNYKKKLQLTDDVLFFRDMASAGSGNILQFSIESSSQAIKVMDVTDMYNIAEVPLEVSGNRYTAKQPADELHEYAAFNPDGNFPEPEFVGEVDNQNLHALNTPEFLIITHPKFLKSANALADFHRNRDNMDVEVVQTNQVYNEFSSGSQSATGIRNCIKMFYDRNEQLKYVLLFGDGSYDNRGINPESSNYIPTYQSKNSLNPTSSFVTDDYFVILDDGESVYNGAVDLGIGRIPAETAFQAELVLNKIENYYTPAALGNWRNIISFIGDDEDSNTHMSQSEQLADYVNSNYGEFVTDKIYFDAFMQETTPAGERYPGVTDAINERVKDGVLILNYIGHANTRFLAHEHVLDISNINSWSNINSLPIFVTATCEFSRFDADEESAGEYVLFNPSGGGIGLFSTTRLVYAWSNFQLSKTFYQYVFERDENGNYYRMGDIMRLAKTNTRNDVGINKRNFSLLADPALTLTYPEYIVETTSINQQDATSEADTIGALQKITVSGFVADLSGNKMENFSGQIIPTVYDKVSVMETLGNAGSKPMTFKVRENIIYKGLAKVTNGSFSFSFVIPKDISYNLGQGKIVYYADNGESDAHGAFDNFYIGGENEAEISDTQGPEIELYMDSPDFNSGDQTSKNPTMLAVLSDENGINTVGTGIGHDITAVLDGDYSNVFVLNNYYQANVDDYTGGSIRFPFKNLSAGEHTLTLKAWDVANNSTEVEISFLVTGNFEISEITNYPNPVSDYTFFVFNHNQSDETLDAIIEVFDQSGRRIDLLNLQVGSNGTSSNPVRWDLSESNIGLQNGIYFYRVIARNSEGRTASKSGKMVVVR